MASPTETNSDSDVTPIARETLNFDDDTLRGEKKREEVNTKEKKKELAVSRPQGGSSSTVSRSKWNLEMLVFKERGKPEHPENNLSAQGREPTTNSTHI